MILDFPIRLLFDESIGETTRSRMNYAFRVFAAVYGYSVVDPEMRNEVRTFFYGPHGRARTGESVHVRIPPLYRHDKWSDRFPVLSTVRYAGEDLYLFHGLEQASHQPDWLGEIFDWLACEYERNILVRDDVGRIPDSELIFERANVAPWKPQAALQMAWLEHFSRNGSNGESLPKPVSPDADTDHFLICSHDVDFYYTNRLKALRRLFKNLAISLMLYKDSTYFFSNLRLILKLAAGERVGDYISRLISRMEVLGCKGTFFVVPLREHRRDPDYALSDLTPLLKLAIEMGFAVELHGSYKSMIENRTLVHESNSLQLATGKTTLGSRQHWLRFGDQQGLSQAIDDARLLFDSSLGFSDTVGFRNGACFAFPPYDFQRERAHTFLEIPLAIMDGSLLELSRRTGESPQLIVNRVLGESRKRGWGGISILWHNPVEALSVPDRINQVFWNSARDAEQFREKWVSSDQFLARCLPRYQNAGLLTNTSIRNQLRCHDLLAV